MAFYIGKLFPCSWFQIIILGCFTKGLSADSFLQMYLIIAGIAFIYLILATMLLKKQEK